MTDKQMMVLLTVDGGEVQQVYEVVEPKDKSDEPVQNFKLKVADTVNLADKPEIPFQRMPIERIDHFLAFNSPGCRYVKVGGVWKRVCT